MEDKIITLIDEYGNEQEVYSSMMKDKRPREIFGIKIKPYVKKYGDINRNEPCPCGSGLKYKKCCIDLKF